MNSLRAALFSLFWGFEEPTFVGVRLRNLTVRTGKHARHLLDERVFLRQEVLRWLYPYGMPAETGWSPDQVDTWFCDLGMDLRIWGPTITREERSWIALTFGIY